MGAYTGKLKAAKVPPSTAEQFWRKKAKRRPNLKGFVLEEVPEATEYSDDDALCDPVEIVRLVKSFPELDELLKEATAPLQERSLIRYLDGDSVPEAKAGRPRLPGRFDLLYVAYVASGDPAMESFWKRWRSSKVWEECDFDERPDYQVMRLRFIEFEQVDRRGFREVAHKLIRNAKKHDRLIGCVLIVDETRFDSVSVHEHCCPDPKACRELWEEQKKEYGDAAKRMKGPPSHLVRATDETYNEFKAQEVEAPELAEGEIPETVAPAIGVEGKYLYRQVAGHLYRTLDLTGGLRKYAFPKNQS